MVAEKKKMSFVFGLLTVSSRRGLGGFKIPYIDMKDHNRKKCFSSCRKIFLLVHKVFAFMKEKWIKKRLRLQDEMRSNSTEIRQL